ncbi:MAG: glycoside hydrolase family 25 protein [Proteobacteria bacterium]|nr:glycoside hydrolase family 25 protein [Pseudomonadota bacterium]
MFTRRSVLTSLAAATTAGCGSRRQTALAPRNYPIAPPPPDRSTMGLDAVIDISHMVTVTDFQQVRRSRIHAVIHKATEGGDYPDRSYATRRPQAEAAGLLWGAYHFGTRQSSGVKQAQFFLSQANPNSRTLMALDLEVSPNPRNSMTLEQAEAFVRTIQAATGRLPVVYVHPTWANGDPLPNSNTRLDAPITRSSILARCDLWVADYHDSPEIPLAWAGRGWKFWQYAADESDSKPAYGSKGVVAGVTHCDRNLFNGDTADLYRYWTGRAST